MSTGAHDDSSGLGTFEGTLPGSLAGDHDVPPRTRSGIEGLQGREIGRYVVLERLGAGAMGVVLAAYDPELDRKVALKLLHPRERSPRAHDGHLRLLAEAQALARLSDPHVVAVHDVGTHEGRVFVAMEFVEGQTLARWLAGGRRPWREVLGVMLRAGQGLRAAHARELVHRDFKPDNVMIGRDGRVRVMDFGLARTDGETSTGPSDHETSQPRQRALDLQLTHRGTLVGTPAYMAPESIAGRRGGAAADQFSFCVTLWEGLHGQRPFTGASLGELYANVLEGRIIEPPPGTGVPRWLRRVVERGLAVDPERRWPSMQALLHALERGRAAARRRRGLGALALVGTAAASVWGVGRYDELRRQQACEAGGASIEAVWNDDVAERVRAAMVGTGAAQASVIMDKTRPWIDAHARAWQEAHAEVCMHGEGREAWDEATLEQARWCLDDRWLELEALVAELARTDATTVHRAVNAAAGLDSPAACTDAEALARMPMPPPELEEDIAAVRAELWRAHALSTMGRYDEALAIDEQGLARAEALGWPPLVARMRLWVGAMLAKRGRFAEAETTLEQAYFEASEAGELPVAFMAASRMVGLLGFHLERPGDAFRWARHAELVLARLPEASDLLRGPLLVDLSTAHYASGDYERAQAVAEQVLELYERRFAPNHPHVADALTNLGVFLQAQGRYAEAQQLYERALGIREEVQGPWHPDLAELLINLGAVELQLGRPTKALPLLQRSLAVEEATLGRDHPTVARILNNLGAVHSSEGQHEAARPLFERALQVLEPTMGPEHPLTAGVHGNLGETLFHLGDVDGARTHLELALRAYEAEPESNPVELAQPLQALASVAGVQGRLDEAVALAERAVGLREAAGSGSDLVAEARFVLARAQWDRGRDRDAARAQARRAADEYREHGTARAEQLAEIERWLADHGS